MSDDRPALSVVICSTGEETTAEAVESVRSSAAAAAVDVEIVVGWQSAACPPAMPGARILRLLPISLSYARNRGTEASRGRVVAFIDADEVVGEGWTAAVLAAIGASAKPRGCFGPIEPRPGDRGIPHCAFTGAEARLIHGASVPPWTVGSGGNMAFDRRALVDLGGFDLLLGAGAIGLAAEDSDVIVRLLAAGATLAWSPEMKVFHPTKSEAERYASRFPYAFGIGRVIRSRRAAGLALRQIYSLLHATWNAVRRYDRRLLRENFANWSGFLQGLLRRVPWESPRRLLEHVPAALAERLAGMEPAPMAAAFRPDPHFLYDCGDGTLLHAYVNPSARLRRAVADRERIEAEASLPGIPRILAWGEGVDSLWLVEEQLAGAHPDGSADAWFDRVAEWAVELGAPLDSRLVESPDFGRLHEELFAACPEPLRPALEAALAAVAQLSAVHVQGDLEPKNLLLDADGVAAVDWEAAQARGMPGIDLVFLAMTSFEQPLDGSTVAMLAAADPSAAHLLKRLVEVGIGPELLRPALLTMLAIWAADERQRLSIVGRAGGPPAPSLFRPMLERLGPRLAGDPSVAPLR